MDGYTSVSVRDDIYEILTEMAIEDVRSVAAQLRFLVQQEQERREAEKQEQD